MRAFTVALPLFLLMASSLGSAHVYNHQDKHEVCDVTDMTPHGHFVGDGHAHTHDGDVEGADMHDHDPCKQTRMGHPGYENKVPLHEIDPPTVELNPNDTVYSDGDPANTEVLVAGEAYRFPIEEGSLKVQTNLVVNGDQSAVGQGFPGSGTYDDPYVIEGYLITGTMLLKDTSACFVIRNNVIVDKALPAPLLPDPQNVVELATETPYWQQVWDDAQALRQQYLDLQAAWDADKAVWDADKAVWDADEAAWDDLMAWYEAEEARWQQAFEDFEQQYIDAVLDAEGVADEFQAYSSQYDPHSRQPAREHAQHIDYQNRVVLDMDALQAAFPDYLMAVKKWIDSTPPPEEQPSGYLGTSVGWELERSLYAAHQDKIQSEIYEYDHVLMPSEPDEVAYQAFLDQWAADQVLYDAFVVDYTAFVASYDAFLSDYNAFQAEFDQVWTETGEDIAAAEEHFAKAAQWTHEYRGQLGTWAYNTVDDLLRFILKTLLGIEDPDDPNNVRDARGTLVLDWNDQCIHVYNNVVNDLRVNQNNDRTGYATGGIFEDNRVFKVGQIRHYDGIFRENEVGNRAHLHALVDTDVEVPTARTVNNDGANQGWYHGNVFYGQVDLDFHGHHHSAGFFAPKSHYHGSDPTIAYMQRADGSCIATHHDVDHMKANGPHHDYPQDDDVEVLGVMVLGDAPHVHAPPPDLPLPNRPLPRGALHVEAGALSPPGVEPPQPPLPGVPSQPSPSEAAPRVDVGAVLPPAEVDRGASLSTAIPLLPLLHDHHEVSCLPHMDHGKRWTSVFFNDNIVIDPFGVGLRFEDQDHRADDEQANSENMRELKSPHFHKKWVQMEDNVVVGRIFIDVLNAPGTLLWSDDWSEVRSPEGPERTREALDHPGAEIVNSHPYRNDAWLDIQRNTFFVLQGAGMVLSDAQHLTRFQFKDNTAYGFPTAPTTTLSATGMLEWLRASEDGDPDTVHAEIESWGGANLYYHHTFAALSNLRDGFLVEYCGNTARGMEAGLVAWTGIYDDGASSIEACGPNDWGGAPDAQIRYTPAPQAPERPTGPLREATADTDDFYVSELAYDQTDAAGADARRRADDAQDQATRTYENARDTVEGTDPGDVEPPNPNKGKVGVGAGG